MPKQDMPKIVKSPEEKVSPEKKEEKKREKVVRTFLPHAKGKAVWTTDEGIVSVRALADEKAAEKVRNLLREQGIKGQVVVSRKTKKGEEWLIGLKPDLYGDKEATNEQRSFRKILQEEGLFRQKAR
jgi:hypothetical protein